MDQVSKQHALHTPHTVPLPRQRRAPPNGTCLQHRLSVTSSSYHIRTAVEYGPSASKVLRMTAGASKRHRCLICADADGRTTSPMFFCLPTLSTVCTIIATGAPRVHIFPVFIETVWGAQEVRWNVRCVVYDRQANNDVCLTWKTCKNWENNSLSGSASIKFAFENAQADVHFCCSTGNDIEL